MIIWYVENYNLEKLKLKYKYEVESPTLPLSHYAQLDCQATINTILFLHRFLGSPKLDPHHSLIPHFLMVL